MGLLRSQPVDVISGETASKRHDGLGCRQTSDINPIRPLVSESHTSVPILLGSESHTSIPMLSESHNSIPMLSESHTSIPEFVVPEPAPVYDPSFTQLELLPPPERLKKRKVSKVC